MPETCPSCNEECGHDETHCPNCGFHVAEAFYRARSEDMDVVLGRNTGLRAEIDKLRGALDEYYVITRIAPWQFRHERADALREELGLMDRHLRSKDSDEPKEGDDE